MNCQAACGPAAEFRPQVDAWETPDAYGLRADVPGAAADSVTLEAKEGLLTLKASVASRAPEGATAVRREYGVGGFSRTFVLGEDIAADGISAQLRDGVLTVRLPKKPEVQPKKIAVAAG